MTKFHDAALLRQRKNAEIGRERGCALLVRGVQVVVVPETGVLGATKLQSFLQRAEVQERELLSWLASTGASARSSSGFHQKAPVPSQASDVERRRRA